MEKIDVELVHGRCYTADSVGAFWKTPGTVQSILPRMMGDYDIRSGLKNGKLRIVKKVIKDAEPARIEDTKPCIGDR